MGSTYGKCAIKDETGTIVGAAQTRSKLNPEETAEEVILRAIENAGEKLCGKVESARDFDFLIGTGYGRDLVPFADANMSEISCHAMGIHSVAPSVRTIIDFGGQDLKGISVDEYGGVENFVMNDKCAAGTGRFFEGMARAFGMSIEEFSKLSLNAKTEVPISSQCSVFAETEVITMIAKRKPPEDIALGIEASVARRCYTLLRGTGLKPDIAITGGCAKNEGLMQCIRQIFHIEPIELPVDPQMIGAIGAAEYAMRRGMKKVSTE